MPSIPQEIFSDWIQPGILVGVIALFLGAFRGLRADLKSEIQASEARQQASEARQEKQVGELKKELRDALKASEDRQQKQMDELKEEFKDVRQELRASEVRHNDALKASEARQKQQMDELKKANEVLAGKVDQLLDAFRAAKA